MKARTILGAVLALAMVVGVTACTRRDESMGPAQEAGKKVDNAGDKIAKDLHGKLDKASQAAKDMAKSAQDTADKANEATADPAKK